MSFLQMSLSAGLLVMAILLIRAVALNKLPKTMFLVLWGVALCRLLVPVFIPVRFGAGANISGIIDRIFAAFSAASSATEMPGGSAAAVNAAEIARPANDAMLGQIDMVLGQILSAAPLIWIGGMLAAFAIFAVLYFRNQRELRFAVLIQNDFLDHWLSQHKLGLGRSLSILQSDRIKTPVAVGIIKPRIILPKSMNMNDKQLLGYVLTHEYYHIKRFDAFWKLILAFALCVHWFNPMVWVMFVLVNRDLELTCDEMVIRHFGAEIKTAYAYSLIGMAEQRSKFAPLHNGFSKNAIKERIVSIMKTKNTSRIGVILACVLVSLLTVGAFAVAADTNETPIPPDNAKMMGYTDFQSTSPFPPMAVDSPFKPKVMDNAAQIMGYIDEDGNPKFLAFDGKEWVELDESVFETKWEEMDGKPVRISVRFDVTGFDEKTQHGFRFIGGAQPNEGMQKGARRFFGGAEPRVMGTGIGVVAVEDNKEPNSIHVMGISAVSFVCPHFEEADANEMPFECLECPFFIETEVKHKGLFSRFPFTHRFFGGARPDEMPYTIRFSETDQEMGLMPQIIRVYMDESEVDGRLYYKALPLNDEADLEAN